MNVSKIVVGILAAALAGSSFALTGVEKPDMDKKAPAHPALAKKVAEATPGDHKSRMERRHDRRHDRREARREDRKENRKESRGISGGASTAAKAAVAKKMAE